MRWIARRCRRSHRRSPAGFCDHRPGRRPHRQHQAEAPSTAVAGPQSPPHPTEPAAAESWNPMAAWRPACPSSEPWLLTIATSTSTTAESGCRDPSTVRHGLEEADQLDSGSRGGRRQPLGLTGLPALLPLLLPELDGLAEHSNGRWVDVEGMGTYQLGAGADPSSSNTSSSGTGLPAWACGAAGQILVVLGGTIGVGVRDHPDHGWMPAELELIQSRLQAGEPVLGDRGWTCWPHWIAGENRSRLAIPC